MERCIQIYMDSWISEGELASLLLSGKGPNNYAFSVVFQLLVLNEDRFTVEYLVMEFPNWDR